MSFVAMAGLEIHLSEDAAAVTIHRSDEDEISLEAPPSPGSAIFGDLFSADDEDSILVEARLFGDDFPVEHDHVANLGPDHT